MSWKPILLHTTRTASLTPLDVEADFASHHSSCKPSCFTPLVLRASHHSSCELHTTHSGSRFCFTPHVLQAELLHTTCPARFTPLVLQAYMLHTIHPASLTPLDVEADFVSHHSSCKPSCFTPHVLQAHKLHTTCPASFIPLILQACRLHTTCPASLHASHHTSCELHTTRPGSRFGFTPHVLQATLLHITCPACFTPLRIQGCVTDRGIQKSLPFFVFAAQFPKLSASFITLSSNHTVTTVLMACMRPERELPYPAQTLFTRVDEQLTGEAQARLRLHYSATTARNVKARWDVRSSSVAYRYSSARLGNVREDDVGVHRSLRTARALRITNDPRSHAKLNCQRQVGQPYGTWKAPAMNATAIVHIVHDHVHYRPVVRHPAFVANRKTSGRLERLLEATAATKPA
ncbi:hypothetical protein Purlil1_14188 [Purpureocillium lilacinum]|uniref:Uncharacterized protein n=1 Tax=Purpureocillium lilacinum TaxID=33203 RepID=A0ABR0BC11_PURLI|nr:hypothetical protein Purlil1_14188 [Purpureocillium lilacinum]